jgi:hypothetical protein
MTNSFCKHFVLLAFSFLVVPFSYAQEDVMNLNNLNKVLLTINWLGNIAPDELGMVDDSTFNYVSNLLPGHLKVMDGRGLNDNPEHTQALVLYIELLSAGEDYVHYAIKLELVEYATLSRLGAKDYRVISWENIKYDLYPKSDVVTHLNLALYDMIIAFADDYNRDNGWD